MSLLRFTESFFFSGGNELPDMTDLSWNSGLDGSSRARFSNPRGNTDSFRM